MRLSGDWLTDPRTTRVFDAVEGAGHRLYFVGGVVRNAAMGLAVTDIDLATDAPPEAVTKAAEAAGLKAVPTGVEHGTVTVVAEGLAHEITTFRRDLETDGRRAVVGFSTRLEDDAARRDFTINALYAGRDGVVVDPVGGLPDLAAKRVRFVGNAAARIEEDYLRILRYFRFHAFYADSGAGFDTDTMAAIASHAAGLDALSRERVGREVLRLLSADDPAPEVAAMGTAGVLARVLPGSDDKSLAPLIHLEAEIGADPEPIRRLAVLGGEGLADGLRLSRKEAGALADLRGAVAMGPGEMGYRLGAKAGRDALLVRAASLGGVPSADDLAAVERGAGQSFPVKAEDLMPALDGPALGAALKRLEAAWIESDFALPREALLAKG